MYTLSAVVAILTVYKEDWSFYKFLQGVEAWGISNDGFLLAGHNLPDFSRTSVFDVPVKAASITIRRFLCQ